MSRATQTLRSFACAVTVGATLAATAGCGVEMGAAYPGGYDYAEYPPDAYLATTEPVYFEGRASYWYGGRWYYRSGRGWNHYEREPPALYQRRMQAAPVRRTYEPYRGRPAGRPSGAPRGRSGEHR
ncbi:MAG TPA: hypothetical protein VN894_04325 [Polyangiaceae bacterium]|nr:hypothetical protein [Polyangiaceae bacterium]